MYRGKRKGGRMMYNYEWLNSIDKFVILLHLLC